MGIRLPCCWPGLASLWYRGLAKGLLLAVLFSWCLGLVMLATFLWPYWLSPWIVNVSWVVLAGLWLSSTIHSHWTLGSLLGTPNHETQRAFVQAQKEYLLGNWFEAEAILLNLLNQSPRDAESLLLLVGVLRHTRRWQPALRRLDQLELLEGSEPWKFEISRERHLIEARRAQFDAQQA